MSQFFYNFYYDVSRQGFDTASWAVLTGNQPTVINNKLSLNNCSIVHYADCYRGDFTVNVNVPTGPLEGDSRSFGLYEYNQGSYLLFQSSNGVFSATASNGTNTATSPIAWQSSWTGSDVDFRIVWGPGIAKFYVGGIWQATINDISVTGNPMSLYVNNANSDGMAFKYAIAKSIQEYHLNPETQNSQVNPFLRTISVGSTLTTSEALTIGLTIAISVHETLTTTEAINENDDRFISVHETLTTTESLPLILAYNITKFETLTTTEAVTVHEA